MQPTLVIKGVFWFVIWTVFSFLAHLFARHTLHTVEHSGQLDKWTTLSLLTLVQLLIGTIVLKLSITAGDRGMISGWNDAPFEKKPSNELSTEEPVAPCKFSLYLSHSLATMATNAGIAFVNTGSAFTIKAFEPISTAVLTSMLLGTRLQTHVIVSLPLVVSGALGFVWQPSLRTGATFGLGMAFVSNVLFGVRNINLKLMHRDSNTMRSQLDLLKRMSLMASGITLLIAITLMIISQKLPEFFNLSSSISSGVFHITYTIVSTCIILTYTSVVGHATCNLLKRIIVAAAFYLIGQTAVSTSNWIMGVVMLIGLAVYVFPTRFGCKNMNPSLSLIAVISTVVILLISISPLISTTTSTGRVTSALPKVDLSVPITERLNELSAKSSSNLRLQTMKAGLSIEDPTKANLRSIQTTTTNELIQEAYRLHEEIFTSIIGKYKKAILVNVFQWFNKGDHLITIGQRKILQRMGIQLLYHCYYPGQNCKFDNFTKPDPEMVVLIQGAGYIGHPSHEFVVSNTLKHFPDRRIMVFPISVCHPTPPCTEIAQFNQIFKSHKDVHLVLRDRYSYDLSKQYFETTHNYLAPDSAFAVGSIRMNIVPIYDIIWLKRNDWESQKDAMPVFPPGITVEVTDWNDDWMKQISSNFWEDHQLRTMTGISFLARGKVIVSDRLHAHIMSQLMGKLNVVINSETKKQEHYYMTWEQSVKTSALVNNNADALKEALRLLKLYDKSVTIV